jgi:serine/threonine-protein kinase
MGSVWAAVNESTSREVAVKLIVGSSADLRHRLLREARACGALKHPNVIDIYDVAQTESGEPFLVMELLSGENLSQILKERRRLEPIEAARIALDVARALSAAHAIGIIHRDLKPANIFLHRLPGKTDPMVKVLDFGVAKNVTTDDGLRTAIGGLVGSPAYMSPEQTRADRDIDHRADLWSLGVVLFQMLTGVRPFTGEAHEVLAKIAKGPIPTVAELVRNTPASLDDLVARCLKRNRDERIASAAEIVRLLDAMVSQGAAALQPPRPQALSSSDASWPRPPMGSGEHSAMGSGQYAAMGSGQYAAMGSGQVAAMTPGPISSPSAPSSPGTPAFGTPARSPTPSSPFGGPVMTPGRQPVPSSPLGGPESRPAPSGPAHAHENAAISSPMGASPPMDELEGPTIRLDPRKVADFVRRETSPAAPAPQGIPAPPAFAGQAPPAFAGPPAPPSSGANQPVNTTPYPVPAGNQAQQPGPWQQSGERSSTDVLMPQGGQGIADGPSDPAGYWGPAMTPHGTIKMTAADAARIDGMVRAKQMTADSSTAPLVQSTPEAPPSHFTPELALIAPGAAAPNRPLRKMLIVAGATTGAGFLVLAILYFAVFRGSGGATAPAASTNPEVTPPASVEPSSPITPTTATSGTPASDPPVPGGTGSGSPTSGSAPTSVIPAPVDPPTAPSTATTPAKPATTTTSTTLSTKPGTGGTAWTPPKKDCSKLKLFEKELCLKSQAAKPSGP